MANTSANLVSLVGSGTASAPDAGSAVCYHCGSASGAKAFHSAGRAFCCHGCQTVFELLSENGLGQFYQLNTVSGVRVLEKPAQDYRFLDEPAVRSRLVEFSDGKVARVRFHLPAIHCIGCVWLLENLFKLRQGIGKSVVSFPRKEISVSFDESQLLLSDIAALLASLGYEPELRFSDLEKPPVNPATRRLYLQLGVAGFVFGNTMLFAIAGYFGMDVFHGPAFKAMFGWVSLILSVPVLIYSAADYWKTAWMSLAQRRLTLDVPIAAGIAALWGQSTWEIVSGHGEGYFDSLAGLLFYLLLGKLFQQKTYDRLAFDRDYRAFFPLSVVRLRNPAPGIRHQESAIPDTRSLKPDEERVALNQLRVGDRLVIRSGELVPADAKLVRGGAVIDYSFVTGESQPVEKLEGDYLYAGGRQMAGAIEIEMVKPVSQSYLTSLWNQEVFQKSKENIFATLTNRLAPRFTAIVIAIAVGAAAYWAFVDPAKSLKSFTSVLIVACPCALALAAPFALGNAQRVLARRNIFLRNANVLETLARVDSVVFDKTGTLTTAGAGEVTFVGAAAGGSLGRDEERLVFSVAVQSTHPLSVRIAESMRDRQVAEAVIAFLETPGCGIEGRVGDSEIKLGSARWILGPGNSLESNQGSTVHVRIDGVYRGHFAVTSTLRPETANLLQQLAVSHEVALLSGDNERERARFTGLFGGAAKLQFNQSPLDKLGFIDRLQKSGRAVMMVGDGLNDAGALKQSDVGVAVVENVGAFSPASDVIMDATLVPQTHELLRYSRTTVRIVRASFLVSTIYNLVGVAIAATGNLSPIVCAVLMPLSSVSVVAFACGLTGWAGRRSGIKPAPLQSFSPSSFFSSSRPRSEKEFENEVEKAAGAAIPVQGPATEVKLP